MSLKVTRRKSAPISSRPIIAVTPCTAARRACRWRLPEQEDEEPAVDDGQGQEVQHREVHADDGHEEDEVDDAALRDDRADVMPTGPLRCSTFTLP